MEPFCQFPGQLPAINAAYMFFRSYKYTNAPVAIVNGITAGLQSEDGIAFNQGFAVTGKVRKTGDGLRSGSQGRFDQWGMIQFKANCRRSGPDDVDSQLLKWSKSLGGGARACDDGVDLVGGANKCSAHVPEFACIGHNNHLL
jgi:hypothetical protein